MSNNAPYAEIQLTKDQYDFLMKNCEVNMDFVLKTLMQQQVQKDGRLQHLFSDTGLADLVNIMENFKSLKSILVAGKL